MNDNIKKFIDTREKFEKADKYNVAMKLDYLINQVNTLFDIINSELVVNESENEVSNTTLNDEIIVEEEETIIDKLAKDFKNDSVDYSKMEVGDIIKEELDAWGISSELTCYKFIVDMVKSAKNTGLTVNSSYDLIARVVCPHAPLLFKRSITFIRKKADFSKSKYLTILSKIKPEKITNEFLLKNILELCY